MAKPGKSALARVRAIALKLPGTEEGMTFGYPAFKVGGKLLAWFPEKKEVEPGSLAVRMSLIERDHRIAARPDVFYVTPHYREHSSALVRSELLSDAELRELLEASHEFMNATSKAKKPQRKR